jgi:hypothetical protein
MYLKSFILFLFLNMQYVYFINIHVVRLLLEFMFACLEIIYVKLK